MILLRGNRAEAIAHYKLDPNKKTILIVGGSQGARAVNNAVLKSLNNNSLDNNEFQILWQTGKRDYKDVTVEAGTRVQGDSLFPFENNMARLYAAADLIIARSGALTLAEIVACEIPALLIPFPYAAGDHQRKNAEDFKRKGFAELIDEKELYKHDILKDAVALLKSDKYKNMKDNVCF